MVADFEMLAKRWEALIKEDAALGFAIAPSDERQAKRLFDSLEEVEAALIAAPASCDREAGIKLQIVGRAIIGGADAAHVADLIDGARTDLRAFPSARAA